MRVAQLVDSLHVGGAEKLQVTFAAVARSRGVDLTVIRLRQDDDSSIPPTLEALGARVVTFPAPSLLDPRRLWSLAGFLRRERFDVLQTHLTYSNVVGALAGRLAGVPVIATLHSAALDPVHRPAIHQLEAAVLRYAPQRIVAVGFTVAETHQPRVGNRAIMVVPNAVAEAPSLLPDERTALRAEMVGDAARPLLICVGRLSPLKGYPDLLRAFASLHESRSDAALAIVGGGELHDELAAQIEALGLSSHATLLGTRDDVPRLLQASDLYVSASHVEGLPLSILEAMAAGLPIVATAVGDVSHILTEGTGVTVPPHQPDLLADAARTLLNEPERMQIMGVAAQRRVAQHYTLDAWMDHLLRLYVEVDTRNALALPTPDQPPTRSEGLTMTTMEAGTMPRSMKLSEAAQARLRCPICGAALVHEGDALRCLNPDDGTRFPVVDGIPVLINEKNSLFSIDDFRQQRKTTMNLGRTKSLLSRVEDVIPTITRNTRSAGNYEQFARLLLAASSRPTVLVVGGSIVGAGMDALLQYPSIEWVETDVSFGPRTALICDGHDVPFEDGSFDGVIVQAVLEHVVDPYRCVAEIHRVLKPQGLVYAETPFMQQVHMGRFDFTRFTHLGHRRLFRHFEEVDSGAVVGPASALAWSYEYFLLSWTTWKPLRRVLRATARLTAFPIKFFDDVLVGRSSALDAASAYYFLGRRSDEVLADRDLIRLYKGSM